MTFLDRASRLRLSLAGGIVACASAVLLLPAAPGATAVPASEPRSFTGTFTPLVIDATLANTVSLPAPTLAPAPAAIVELADPPLPSGRPTASQPRSKVRVVVKPPPPPPAMARPITHHALGGRASWLCKAGVSACTAGHPDRAGVADMYAAAGPRLRRAICGSDTSNCWRGRRATVNGVTVVLADWCQCYKGRSNEKVIDLYWDAWTRVPGVTSGVTVRW